MRPGEVRPLSLAFIGGSLTSAVGYVHFVASRLDDRFHVEAGCFSTDEERNRQTAATYGVAPDRVYRTWRDLVAAERGRIDVVAVLTPTPAHAEMVVALIDAGIPVICEKALATRGDEVEAIVRARDARRGFVAVTYNYSGYPAVRELRRLVDSGALGGLLHFQAEMPQEGFIRLDARGDKPSPQPWRLSDGRVPTIHLDLGVHLHHLLYYVTGERPVEVLAEQSSFGWFPRIVDNVSALCRTSSGMQGQIWFSKAALGYRNGLRLRIYGAKASAEWLQSSPEELVLCSRDGRREVVDRGSPVEIAGQRRYNRFKAGHPAGFIEAFANLYEDLAEALKQHRAEGAWRSDEVFGAELALDGLRFLEAMADSAATRQWRAIDPTASSGRELGELGRETVRAFVRRLIEKSGPLPASVDIDFFDYLEAGYVDSIGLIKFVADLEERFDIEISEGDMESPSFRTVGGLVALIERRMQESRDH